jgi:hypothetical protein
VSEKVSLLAWYPGSLSDEILSYWVRRVAAGINVPVRRANENDNDPRTLRGALTTELPQGLDRVA